MKSIRIVCVLLSLVTEIRVKAQQQDPEKCIQYNNQACSLFAAQPTTTKIDSSQLLLSAGTILYRDSNRMWNFVSGTVRVSNKKPWELLSRVGRIQLQPGIHWLQWRDDKLWVYCIVGSTRLSLLSDTLSENVLAGGFYNWYGLIDKTGNNVQGIMRVLDGQDMRKFLPGLHRTQDLSLVKKNETRSIAMVSEFYGEVAQQMQDEATRRQTAQENREIKRRVREKEVRDDFRRKYLGPVDFDDLGSDSSN